MRRFLKAVKHRIGQIPLVRRICWPEPRRSWLRTATYHAIDDRLEALAPVSDVVEISGAAFTGLPWRSYDRLTFPDFDLCAPGPHGQYDVVICDQILEHVVDPALALRTLFALCRPGGLVVTMTPFLYLVHEAPGDYWRFTPNGLALLLERAGFEEVTVGSWGNRTAVAAHLVVPIIVDLPWLPRRNRANYPIQVWGFGRRAGSTA